MKDAANNGFFSLFSLFIENFPNEVFSENTLKVSIGLGKSLFSLVDSCSVVLDVINSLLIY